jgi:hypothetical protein
MSFSTDMAKLVANQLTRFVTLNRHQLAGQVANLDFWIEQVRHGLNVIDGYGKRYQLLKSARAKHVTEHHTVEFRLDDPCCTQGPPSPVVRIPDSEMREARRQLTESAYRFLVRCCNEEFISESRLRSICGEIGIGVEIADLRRKRQ